MRRLFFVLVLTSISISMLSAQPCPEEPCPPGGDGTPPVPLAGIEILLTGGMLYGVSILSRKRKQKNSNV